MAYCYWHSDSVKDEKPRCGGTCGGEPEPLPKNKK